MRNRISYIYSFMTVADIFSFFCTSSLLHWTHLLIGVDKYNVEISMLECYILYKRGGAAGLLVGTKEF